MVTALSFSLSAQSAFPPRWLKSDVARAGDEELVFTPPGFDRPGKPARAMEADAAFLRITVVDDATGRPTLCRVNVVGPDGQFYQPADNPYAAFSLDGTWPLKLAGNRAGKAPIRYLGRFFYTRGGCVVKVPPGPVRVEAWKGFEFAPVATNLAVRAKEGREVKLTLRRTVAMTEQGWHPGDPHLHFARQTGADDQLILDLLEAEDVRHGGVLCYNSPASYDGRMERQDIPQARGLGIGSIHRRGDYQIISGQEYRSGQYGHTKVFLADELVQAGRAYDPNNWPVFGEAVRGIRKRGGIVFWAHGGYEKEIYADYLLGAVDGVELLQFGIYRPIGLEGWYRMLNLGFRLPAGGASDYPACRKLADCRTYVHLPGEPRIDDWLRGMAAGRSFFTTGPLLLLEVEGSQPGAVLQRRGPGPHTVRVNVRVRCEVAPVTHLDLVANGATIKRLVTPRAEGRGRWLEMSATISLRESTWLATTAYSEAANGSADAEAHTNPVYVYLDGKAPYREADAEWLLAKLDGQIAAQRKRKDFAGKDRVVDYFERARTRLLAIRMAGGQPAP